MEAVMKVSSFSVFVLLMVISFPITSDAFSRRSHHSEMGPQSAPLNSSQTQSQSEGNSRNASAQAVPEPPVLLLMSFGIGLLGVGTLFQRLRRPDGSSR
jgi:hypothetical protein